MKIKTEDGVELTTGDWAYNYYDRYPGIIGEIDKYDHWFYFKDPLLGTNKFLNGERICSIEFATKKGWLTTDG